MTEEKLVRGISRWDLTAIAINTIIGTGIFILPARVFGLIGNYSLLAFIACAVIIGFIILCFAEVSSRFSATGGMYLYAKEAFGSVVGFEVGWLYWIVRVTTFATNCNALLLYLKFFFSGADEGYLKYLIVTLVVVIITIFNFIGVRESVILTNFFTIGKIIPLLVFAAVGIFFIEPSNFNFGAPPEQGKFFDAILILIYAFAGFEASVIPAGETKDPQKNVPFALFSALMFCTILFIIIQIVAIGTLPGLAESKTPLADSAGKFLGYFGLVFITIGALVSVLGNLNGGFLATSRIPYAMAEQKELPQIIGKTHARFKTPHISILLTGIVILVFTLQTSFYSALTIATITRLLVYATTCAALPVFRNRKDVPEAKFIAPFGILASILSLLLIVWLLTRVDYSKEGLAIIILAVIGLVFYFIYSFFGKKQDESRSENGENL